MTKKEITKILINEYCYLESQIQNNTFQELEKKLMIERKKRENENRIEDFWIIDGLPRPSQIFDEQDEKTKKYAWWIFGFWIGTFIAFGLFMFLMIYFFAN